jgi:hypothetical protein
VTFSCKVLSYCFNFHVVILAPPHITTTIDLSASPALLRSLMNSTNIYFITEFMQTMLSKRQTSPPRRSAQLPSNCLAQAQGAQAAGQAASQHASLAVLPVELPCTTVAISSSTRLTWSSSKAIATTLPYSAEANCIFGGSASILISRAHPRYPLHQ